MKIVEFKEKYRKNFIDFNTEWIVSNFKTLENEDIETFNSVDEIIKKGGMIFFAIDDENDKEALACCMVKPVKDGVWEIAKLASNSKIPHKGAGSAVFKKSMEWAALKGAKKIIIISNTKLKAALHIYEKFGFIQIKRENYGYERGDIAFEYNVKGENMKTKTVVKKEDALKRTFKGVNLDSLAVGEKSMVTKMNYVKGNFATLHAHPNEQLGYVISGSYRLIVKDENIDTILKAGDSYAIKGGAEHSFEVLEGGEVVDVFTPQREDYL